MRKVYNDLVHSLLPNEYFVFGSNTQGKHGKGAALTAKRKFGAIYGQAKGFQGQSYAIVTKDLQKTKHPSISKKSIINQIVKLYDHAKQRPDRTFYVAYSGSPTVVYLNGYTRREMASMFNNAIIPSNIIFEEKFWLLIITS